MKVEFRADYFDKMPGLEIDKQIDQLLGKSLDVDATDMTTDVWKPPVPEYAFVERARIADAFFGPEVELIAGEKTLAQRIQAVIDMGALCNLREQSRRGKPFNWNKAEEATTNDTILHHDNEDMKTMKPLPPSPLGSPRPFSDQSPFCFSEDGLRPVDHRSHLRNRTGDYNSSECQGFFAASQVGNGQRFG
jgi:hypothetical protein